MELDTFASDVSQIDVLFAVKDRDQPVKVTDLKIEVCAEAG